MISSIEDDDIRKSYATRAKNKYDSLKDETVKWKDVVKAYEEQQKESNAELAREKKTASKNARNKQLLIPDANKKFVRIYIDSLNDLYKYKNRLIEVVKRYM